MIVVEPTSSATLFQSFEWAAFASKYGVYYGAGSAFTAWMFKEAWNPAVGNFTFKGMTIKNLLSLRCEGDHRLDEYLTMNTVLQKDTKKGDLIFSLEDPPEGATKIGQIPLFGLPINMHRINIVNHQTDYPTAFGLYIVREPSIIHNLKKLTNGI